MKSIDEKEKKLLEVLNELKNLKINDPGQIAEFKLLENQKNQLEIEKIELLEKYNSLVQINENLKIKLEDFNKKEINDKIKEDKFSEKIEELNQETDNLMDEIDKWQM